MIVSYGKRFEMISQKRLLDDFASLPPEAQRRLFDFMASLKTQANQRVDEDDRPILDLQDEPFVGMWRDRDDMNDSNQWIRRLREGGE